MTIIARLPDDAASGPVLVHSDAFRARRNIQAGTTRSGALEQHLKNILQLADGRTVLMPSFNYDFAHTHRYDVEHDPSQVGPITEAFRQAAAARGATPIFNLTSSRPGWNYSTSRGDPDQNAVIDPFSKSSELGRLIDLEGNILLYGAPFHPTIVHVTERAASVPYRFEKRLHGTVVEGSHTSDVALSLHVFPRGLSDISLTYDWERLAREARSEGVLRDIPDSNAMTWAPARTLHEFWLGVLAEDPLGLLEPRSRRWVEVQLESLGRPFLQGDFE